VSTLTTFNYMTKLRYTPERVANLTLKDNPWLGLIKKNSGFSGEGMRIPIIGVNPQGTGATRAGSQTAKTNSGGQKFTLVTGEYDGSVDIGDKVLKSTRDNNGAFLENKVVEMDGLYETMASDLDVYLHGNGGNSLGQITSVSTNTLLLTNVEDAVNFEVGMILEGSATDGTSGAVYSGTATVTAVARDAGTVTVDDATAINTGTGAAADDYLFRAGTHAQTSGVDIVHGIQEFIYSTSTGVPALLGMTRTSDPIRYAGCRVPSSEITSMGIEQRLRHLGMYMTGQYHGPGADTGLLNPYDWERLSTSLQSRGYRPANDSEAKFGYMMIEAVLGGKRVKLYPDYHQPRGLSMLLKKDTWTLWSILNYIHAIEADGIQILRGATTNQYEYRLISYPGQVCNAPGHNGRVAV